MTIHPDRLRRMRNDYDRAVTILGYGQLPTNREFIQIVEHLGDALSEYTSTHRSRP